MGRKRGYHWSLRDEVRKARVVVALVVDAGAECLGSWDEKGSSGCVGDV